MEEAATTGGGRIKTKERRGQAAPPFLFCQGLVSSELADLSLKLSEPQLDFTQHNV
jgi:hypothetical protein